MLESKKIKISLKQNIFQIRLKKIKEIRKQVIYLNLLNHESLDVKAFGIDNNYFRFHRYKLIPLEKRLLQIYEELSYPI